MHHEPEVAKQADGTIGTISPVTLAERQKSLDFIRGIAIFGILIMNIQTFGNVFASYFNPTVNGDFSGINQLTWLVTHVFFEQKFYTIFSMLFGAGIVLMTEKSEQAYGISAGLHYRRNFLLLCFGLVHGFFIWYGDILTVYGFCALFVFFARHAKPRSLIISGLSLTLIVSLMMLLSYGNLPPEQLKIIESSFFPPAEKIDSEILAYLGSWTENQVARTETMANMLDMMIFGGIKISGCMLFGMALFKMRIINGRRCRRFYRNLALIGLLTGIPIVAFGGYLLVESGFSDAQKTQMLLGQFNFVGSLLVALGYIGLFHWFYQSLGFKSFKQRFEAVGQMAFTNYLTQSIICTFIFYGYGLGYFNQLERYQLIFVAVAVFAAQWFWSSWWLSKFYYGPFEWVWRSLTYLKLQKFKRVEWLD